MRTDKVRPVIIQHPLGRAYDSIEFTLATGITNYDVKANVASAFNNLPVYTTVSIRTDKTLTLRFNSTSNPGITVERRGYEVNNLIEITNMYFTNSSGSTATIYILGIRKGE